MAPAHRPVGAAPAWLAAESHTIESESGAKFAAWFTPVKDSRATIVLLHPLRGDRTAMLDRARLLLNAQFSVLLVDLQAHGESTGDHITAGHLEKFDAKAAVEFARRRNPNHKIGVLGWSLGGAAALLASPLQIDALAIESVYPTIEQAVENRLKLRIGPSGQFFAPCLLWQLKPRFGISVSDLRPVDRIPFVHCPILIASGGQDQHTTIADTMKLVDAAKEPKTLVLFEHAQHEDLFRFDSTKYEGTIVPFFVKHLQVSDPKQ